MFNDKLKIRIHSAMVTTELSSGWIDVKSQIIKLVYPMRIDRLHGISISMSAGKKPTVINQYSAKI